MVHNLCYIISVQYMQCGSLVRQASPEKFDVSTGVTQEAIAGSVFSRTICRRGCLRAICDLPAVSVSLTEFCMQIEIDYKAECHSGDAIESLGSKIVEDTNGTGIRRFVTLLCSQPNTLPHNICADQAVFCLLAS